MSPRVFDYPAQGGQSPVPLVDLFVPNHLARSVSKSLPSPGALSELSHAQSDHSVSCSEGDVGAGGYASQIAALSELSEPHVGTISDKLDAFLAVRKRARRHVS